MKRKDTINSQRLVVLVVLFSFVLIFYKLSSIIFLKETDGINLVAFAKNRNTTSETLYAGRGNILDKDGNLLAQSVKSYTLIAFLDEDRTTNIDKPKHVINKDKTARELARVLNISEKEILEKLHKDKYQVEIKKNISEVLKSKIDLLELDGLGYIESLKRYYKGGTFASYLIGYAKATDDGELVGELGLEGYFDKELKGVNGFTTYQKDPNGYKFTNTYQYIKPAKPGADVYLTIDSNIQLILENTINNIEKNGELNSSSITVLDALTGAIVGSATSPSYNPNDLNTISSFVNPVVSSPFEPGSTMKAFSFAAAIDTDNYKGEETYMSGSIKVDDFTIRDFNKGGWGEITYDRGFAMSSNVAATKIALNLGNNILRTYYDRLGFGQKTGIELFAEATGKTDFRYKSELATAAFGQGISVTPIQMLQAFTTMANDGVMLKPYVVEKIVDSNEKIIYSGKRTEVSKVYKKSTTDYMKNLLFDAIYDGNTTLYRPKNVTILGKTGTAQIASPRGGYLEGDINYVYSFISLFPKEEPKYILYIATKQYTGSRNTLANATVQAIEEIASYAKITDKEKKQVANKKIVLNNYISRKTTEIKKDDLNYITIGNGSYIINQFPLKDSVMFKGDKVFLITNGDDLLMPSVIGYSEKEIKTLANMLELKLKITGSGVVTNQSIEKNAPINKGDELKVILS